MLRYNLGETTTAAVVDYENVMHRRGLIGNKGVPKIILNNTINLSFFKLQSAF